MAYNPYYPNGWKSGEVGGTPITPEALNRMEGGISGAVQKSGDTMTGNLTIKKETPGIFFYNSGDNAYAAMVYEVVDSGGNNRLALSVRKGGSAGQEIYFLPVPDAHSSQTFYGLLTSKSAVTINQGGTGATNKDDARDNLYATYSGYSDADNWADLWANHLSKINEHDNAVMLLGSNAASVLSNGKISSVIGVVIIAGGSASNRTLRVMAMSDSGGYQYSWKISSATSSDRTTGTVYRYAGTAI